MAVETISCYKVVSTNDKVGMFSFYAEDKTSKLTKLSLE